MTSRTGTSWLLSGCLAVGLLAAWPAAPARACGGLFCSAAMPVNQAAERIIFSYDKPNKKVTAVVEILYQGPSEKFAWVLPVPGIPQVGVSTSALLDRLQAVTNPTYTIQRTWGGQCGGGPEQRGRPADGAAAARGARWRGRRRVGRERAGRGQRGPVPVRGHHGQPRQLRPRHGGDRVAEGQRLRRRGAGAGRAAPLPARRPQPAGVQAGQEQDGRVHPPGDADLRQRPPDDPHPPDGGGGQRRHGHPGLGAGLGAGGAHQLQDAGAERGDPRLVQPGHGLQRCGRRRGRRGRRARASSPSWPGPPPPATSPTPSTPSDSQSISSAARPTARRRPR